MDLAFRLCLARHPAPEEKQRLLALLDEEGHVQPVAAPPVASKPGAPDDLRHLAAWTTVARVLLNLDETITRE